MAGRHAAQKSRPTVPYVLLLVGALVVVLAGLGTHKVIADRDTAAASASTGTACDAPSRLRVVAAPEVVPAVHAAAAELAGSGCVRLDVTAATGADALRDVSAGRADVWVPDSSTWVDQLASKVRREWTAGPSIASSPIGVARSSI